MNWRAIVPLKRGADRKTRLAGRLSPEARFALSESMARHVLGMLAQLRVAVRVLAPEAMSGVALEPDLGAGLNEELARVGGEGPLLVVHADLPLLTADDVAAMIEAAEADGAAIAPDRWGSGTNAVALYQARPRVFAFGADSFLNHRSALPGAAIVRREGLAFDIDVPTDLDALERYRAG